MDRKSLKTLVIKTLKFVVIFIVIDFSLGFVAKQLFFHQTSGKFARLTYALQASSSNVLIFGSSHANRHFVPQVFEDSLHLSSYNVGVQGQRILFQSAIQEIILSRTTPKTIILNIDGEWLYKSNEAYERLSDLHPYYWDNRAILKPILSKHTRLLDFKLLFKSYQMNSTIIHIAKYYGSPQKDFDGYTPLFGQMKADADSTIMITQEAEGELDPAFIAAYKSFIARAREKKIDLIFVVSPTFYRTDFSNNVSFQTMKEIAAQEHVPLFDFTNDPIFVGKAALFNDDAHLNDTGARLFSQEVAHRINSR